jgi:hypothetical protein
MHQDVDAGEALPKLTQQAPHVGERAQVDRCRAGAAIGGDPSHGGGQLLRVTAYEEHTDAGGSQNLTDIGTDSR